MTTALALVDREGLAGLTMRRLGAELGVDPMAVYYHLPNKAALFDGLVEAVYAEVDVSAATALPGWRDRMAAAMREVRAALRRHPHVVPVFGTRPATTPTMFRMVEAGLRELRTAGFSVQQALDVLSCISYFTIGHCLAEVGQPVGGETADPRQAVAALDPEQFPFTLAAYGEFRFDADVQFELGLTAMLAGFPDPPTGG